MNLVYMLRCADNTLYSGWTCDLTRRLAAHRSGTAGAKYTRSRRPITLVYCHAHETQSEAMRHEAALKRLSRAEKERVIAEAMQGHDELLEVLDAQNQPCGILPRALVHRCGLRHRVAHLLVCQAIDGVPGVWLQQRGFDRPTLPGKYDWTATGHLSHGETPEIGVRREAREEVGLELAHAALLPAAETHRKVLYGAAELDDQIAHTFLYFAAETPAFVLGPEVVRVVWASVRDIDAAFKCGTPLRVRGDAEESVPAALLSPYRAEWNKIKARCRAGCAGAQKMLQETRCPL